MALLATSPASNFRKVLSPLLHWGIIRFCCRHCNGSLPVARRPWGGGNSPVCVTSMSISGRTVATVTSWCSLWSLLRGVLARPPGSSRCLLPLSGLQVLLNPGRSLDCIFPDSRRRFQCGDTPGYFRLDLGQEMSNALLLHVRIAEYVFCSLQIHRKLSDILPKLLFCLLILFSIGEVPVHRHLDPVQQLVCKDCPRCFIFSVVSLIPLPLFHCLALQERRRPQYAGLVNVVSIGLQPEDQVASI